MGQGDTQSLQAMLMLYLTKGLTEVHEHQDETRKQLSDNWKEARKDLERQRKQWDERVKSTTKLLRSHHLALLPSVFGDWQ